MPLDSPVQRDGDNGFLGFASRLNPLTLRPGMLQDSVNMRLDRGVAQTRKGSKRLTDNVTADAPLFLDVLLGVDKPISAGNLTRSSTTATVVLNAHGYTTGDKINIRGASESQYNGDFTITVVDANTFTYAVSGSPATPATGTIIANNGPELFTTYDGGIFAGGVFASQNYENASEWVVLAGKSRAWLWRDGEAVVEKTYPTSPAEVIDQTDIVSVVQAFDRLYILREAARSGDYAEKLTNASGITVSSTTATVNVTAHGYPEGARVRIEGSTTPAFDGHEFAVLGTNLNTNSFEITVPSGTATHAAATIKVRRVKPPIYWDGGSGNFVRATGGVPAEGVTYTTMPSTGWASYINNRLWFARNRDTVAISDVLDADLYDPFWNSFRAGAGGDDRIVAVHPWVEGQALVFCRKSIWLATLNEFASTDGSAFSVDTPVSRLTLLTNEIGCSARNTIVTAGNFVFFLSDAGIYRLDTRLDLKLRGDTRPLSEPIADLFSIVDPTRVEQSATAAWYNNRYIIALPTSPEPLDGNELVICWNALNEQWEFRDTFPPSAAVNQIIVAAYDGAKRAFTSPRSGNLYILDEQDSGEDDSYFGSPTPTTPVVGRITTRRLNFNDMHSKRFMRAVADVVIPPGATVSAIANTINPDKDEELVGSITNSSSDDEDYNMKSSIRFKAHAVEMTYETSNGRPEIRAFSVEASLKSMPSQETRNAA